MCYYNYLFPNDIPVSVGQAARQAVSQPASQEGSQAASEPARFIRLAAKRTQVQHALHGHCDLH